MAIALENPQIGDPRSHRVPILMGEDPRDLMKVGQVVDCPGGKQLGERYRPESGMEPLQRKIRFGQTKRSKLR
jgi:hypothetical protein